MSTQFLEKTVKHINPENPFDLLFRNFFETNTGFLPAIEAKFPHPVDIYETDLGLHFEVACTGLEKSDIDLSLEGDVVRISHTREKDSTSTGTKFIHKGIAKRSFNLGYKISSKYNLSKATAEMKNGLLNVSVPFAKSAVPRILDIA